MTAIPMTERTKVRRLPKRANYDVATIHAILDEALICHVGFVVASPDAPAAPVVIPTIHWREGDTLYLRTGGPVDDEEDYALPVWAGVLPLALVPGVPIADEGVSAAVPDYVARCERR